MNLLDEDELLDLHTRIRRARNKDVGIHRREGSARVGPKRARGKANRGNRLNAEKVEVFEYALASVSKRVAVVARQAAEDLKAERPAATCAPSCGRQTWLTRTVSTPGRTVAVTELASPTTSPSICTGTGRSVRTEISRHV